jgi:cyclophilin family peptidyl-prolyl cis-trans isomerase
MKRILIISCVLLAIIATGCAAKKEAVKARKKAAAYVEPTTNRIVQLSTDYGIITIALSDSTPLHRNNFIKLVKQHFYDSVLFHRVISQFMIQGGDPTSKNATANTMLGNGGSDMERIPAEFNKALFHRKGALAAARDGNPLMASSACQFYIVQGKSLTDMELDQLETQKGFKYPDSVRAIYKTNGGTPHLDMGYTVFGQVINGYEVIDKIAALPVSRSSRPLTDVRMKIILIH